MDVLLSPGALVIPAVGLTVLTGAFWDSPLRITILGSWVLVFAIASMLCFRGFILSVPKAHEVYWWRMSATYASFGVVTLAAAIGCLSFLLKTIREGRRTD
jgi:hypothetical protein